MIEKLLINQNDYSYVDYDGSLRGAIGSDIVITGWRRPLSKYANMGSKIWYLHGKPSTAMQVFESLTDEQKEEAIWELNEWK